MGGLILGRVHLDACSNVHPCQGLCLGILWQTPLAELVASYTPPSHPMAGSLLRGGLASLAHELVLPSEDAYVDACRLCYSRRHALLGAFPQYLAPRQVYGLNP